MIDNYKVWLCKNKIVFYMPKSMSFFGKKASHSFKYALYDIIEKVKNLENLLQINIKINKRYIFRVGRQHYAEIKNRLAEHYNRDNKQLLVETKRGEVWLITDRSYYDELETIHKKTALDDMDKAIIPFFNSLRENPGYTPGFVLNILGSFLEGWQGYAENIKSHVEAIKNMSSIMKEFKEIMENVKNGKNRI